MCVCVCVCVCIYIYSRIIGLWEDGLWSLGYVMMEAKNYSETLLTTYKTTRRHKQEDHNPHSHLTNDKYMGSSIWKEEVMIYFCTPLYLREKPEKTHRNSQVCKTHPATRMCLCLISILGFFEICFSTSKVLLIS
jgi:hypothetical protein